MARTSCYRRVQNRVAPKCDFVDDYWLAFSSSVAVPALISAPNWHDCRPRHLRYKSVRIPRSTTRSSNFRPQDKRPRPKNMHNVHDEGQVSRFGFVGSNNAATPLWSSLQCFQHVAMVFSSASPSSRPSRTMFVSFLLPFVRGQGSILTQSFTDYRLSLTHDDYRSAECHRAVASRRLTCANSGR